MAAQRLEAELGAHRRHRRDACGAPCGHEDGEHGDTDTDDEGDDDGARLEHDPEVGEPGAGGVEDGDDELGDADAGEDADDRRDHRDHQGLDDDESAHLAAGAADGAQQGELAQSLTDRDGEHVVDQEGADEGGDAGEDQQPGADRPDELVDGAVRLVDECFLVDDLDVVGEDLGDALLHGGDVFAVGDADLDGVDDALGAEDLGGRRRVPQGERRPAEAVAVLEADGPGEREGVAAGGGDDTDFVADLEVVVVGGVLVDGHLIGSARSGALAYLDRVVLVAAVPGRAEHRRPAGRDDLAVAVDDLSAALQRPVGVGDSRHGGHGVDELCGHGITGGLGVVDVAEGERRAHLQVGVLEGGGEQRVEARAQGVGEHEGTDDERDAEDDGDGDGDEPADAGAHAPPGEQEGGAGAHLNRRSASAGRARCRASARPSRRRCGRR